MWRFEHQTNYRLLSFTLRLHLTTSSLRQHIQGKNVHSLITVTPRPYEPQETARWLTAAKERTISTRNCSPPCLYFCTRYENVILRVHDSSCWRKHSVQLTSTGFAAPVLRVPTGNATWGAECKCSTGGNAVCTLIDAYPWTYTKVRAFTEMKISVEFEHTKWRTELCVHYRMLNIRDKEYAVSLTYKQFQKEQGGKWLVSVGY